MPPSHSVKFSTARFFIGLLLSFCFGLAQGDNVSGQGILILDSEKEFNSTQILERLLQADDAELSGATGFPKHENQYWFALELKPSTEQRWAIRLANAHFKEIEAFLYHKGQLIHQVQSGYQASTEGLHTLSVDWLAELSIEQGQTYQLIIRVASPIVSSLNVHLESYDQALIYSTARTSFLFFLIGISLSLALHNLFFGASVRDISHILYAIHSLFGVLFIISAYGLFKTVFGFYDYELYFYKPASVGVQLFGTWFCYVFFQVPRRLRELDWAFKALIVFYVLLLMAYPFMSREAFSIASAAPHPIFGTLMIVSAAWAYIRGLKPAIYVCIGWIALIAGSTFPALVTIGLAPSFESILMVGLSCHVFEMYMLSLAISQKFRSIQLDNIAAKETDKSRSAFISYFSHEVKTPINGILGLIKLLKQTSLEPVQNKYVEQINRSGHQLLQQLNSVLLLESGRQQQTKTQATSLLDVLDSSVSLIQGLCDEKDILVEYLIEPNVPTVIETDPDLLQQLINNLLNNAAKYTENGEIKIVCSGKYLEDGDMALCFSVNDTGIGIPYEDQYRIFHSFTKASNNNHNHLVGTGMGLAIVKNISDRLGGKIEFNSVPGKGSTFEFHLHVRIAAHSNNIDKCLSVLLVDDIELNNEIIASLLKGAGHTVYSTTDPKDALAAADKHEFDAILLDIHMPLFSGQDLMSKLREAGVDCAIIGISAGLTPELSLQLQHKGMELLMEKPFSLPIFYSLIQRHQSGFGSDLSEQRYNVQFINDIAQYKTAIELDDFFKRYQKSCLELSNNLEQFAIARNSTDLAACSHRLAGLCAALGILDCAKKAKQLQQLSEGDPEAVQWNAINMAVEQFQLRLKNGLNWLTQQIEQKTNTH